MLTKMANTQNVDFGAAPRRPALSEARPLTIVPTPPPPPPPAAPERGVAEEAAALRATGATVVRTTVEPVRAGDNPVTTLMNAMRANRRGAPRAVTAPQERAASTAPTRNMDLKMITRPGGRARTHDDIF